MNSRDEILSKIRALRLPQRALPPLYEPSERLTPSVERFTASLFGVGGEVLVVEDERGAEEAVRTHPRFSGAVDTICCNAGALSGSRTLDAIADARELETVQAAVVRAELGVCENGAVWCPASAYRHRAVLFLAEHLFVLLPVSRLVSTMHDAYERLGEKDHGTGYFISGPTKTADIEQNLVIGAQGPRSLVAIVMTRC